MHTLPTVTATVRARPRRTGLALGLVALLGCAPTEAEPGPPSGPGPGPRLEEIGTRPEPETVRPLARDWTKSPAIFESDTSEDLYALGDVHGDYQRLTDLLVKHRLLAAVPDKPESARWAGGHATLICTGDVIDKWKDGMKVLALFQALQASARVAGGQVVLLLGNHEAEFLADPKSDKVDDFSDELKGAGLDPSDVAKGRHPIGAFLRGLPVAARVREWFFSHAGNTSGRTLAALARDLQTGIDGSGYDAGVLSDDDSIVEARLSPKPWWEKSGDPKTTLTTYAHALGAEHIVFGHQPGSYSFAGGGGSRKKGQVFQVFGRAFLLDAGMSRDVDYSKGALLRISGRGTAASATILAADGTATALWHG